MKEAVEPCWRHLRLPWAISFCLMSASRPYLAVVGLLLLQEALEVREEQQLAGVELAGVRRREEVADVGEL